MKPDTLYRVIFLFVILFIYSDTISAQESKDSGATGDIFNMSIEELLGIEVYSISKQEEKLSEAPMSVYQISKDELNRWGVRNLYETLGRVPGYTFYNTDYYGQYGVMARGWQSIWRYGYSIELMPLIDFGHTSFPHEFFESVEAARGPAGLAWGSSANAGLVNANIRSNLEGTEVVAQYGNQNQYSLSVLYGQKFDNNRGEMFFGFNQEAQDYEIQPDAFGQPGNNWKTNGLGPSYSFIGKVKYDNFKAIVYSEHTKRYSPQLWFQDAYARDTTTGGWQKTNYAQFWQDVEDSAGVVPNDQLKVLCYRLEYQLPVKNRHVDVNLYHNYYNKIWYFEPVGSGGDQKRDFGFNANFNFFGKKLNIALGSDLFGEELVNMYTNNHRFAVDRGINWYDNTYSTSGIHYFNAFTQASYRINKTFKVIAGTRADYQQNEMFDNTILFYRGGLVCNINENTVAKYFYNNAPRRPQANEWIQSSPEEEYLSAHELAVIGNVQKRFDYNITLYHQVLKNQITRNPVSYNDFLNTGGLEVIGLEWGINTMPVRNLNVYWNGSVLSPEVIIGQVQDSTGNLINVDEEHNSNNQPLFIPTMSSFLGAEYNFGDIVKVNIAWRGIYNIPYLSSSLEEKYANTDFVDLTIRSKKFWDMLEVSVSALNLLDNRNGLPAYGEHAKNQPGVIEPEGVRFYLKTRFTIPSKL